MMKKYITIIFITLMAAGSSCKKDYLNLDTNPNVPSKASPNLLLSGALKNSAANVNSGNYVMYAAWVGYMSQSTGFQPFVALELYQFTTSTYDVWSAPYLNISNYTALAASTTAPYYQAIAKIMTVHCYQGLVDNYNNVPYTDAIKGTGNLNPTYTKGDVIYTDLMKQLDAAIDIITKAPAGSVSPAGADIMFGGNMTNWVKFANTLKLRLAIRTQSTGIGAALAAAAHATQGLGYLDGSVDARVNPGYTNSDANGGEQSPLWLYYGTNQQGAGNGGNSTYQANSYAANFFGSNSDPRLIRVYSASPTAAAASLTTGDLLAGSAINTYKTTANVKVAIVSTTFGDSQPPASKAGVGLTPSKVGPGVLKAASMPAIIISGAESLFLQAEGWKAGIITATPTSTSAQDAYNAGITASFIDLNAQQVDDDGTVHTPAQSAATLYGPGGKYEYPLGGSPEAKEKAIITQKWAALAVSGAFEAFNENRRTGYPAVPTSIYPGADAPNQVTRIFYPFVEYATNAANVAAQGNIDKFSSKIFWAK